MLQNNSLWGVKFESLLQFEFKDHKVCEQILKTAPNAIQYL